MLARHVQVDYEVKGKYIALSFDTNLLTKMWHLVTTSRILVSNFFYYVKLVELAMVLVVGSVEDERYFSTLAFMKSKLHIRLTTHLPLAMRIFAQHFYIIQKFPYEKCIE
jgi:hypothetical protein